MNFKKKFNLFSMTFSELRSLLLHPSTFFEQRDMNDRASPVLLGVISLFALVFADIMWGDILDLTLNHVSVDFTHLMRSWLLDFLGFPCIFIIFGLAVYFFLIILSGNRNTISLTYKILLYAQFPMSFLITIVWLIQEILYYVILKRKYLTLFPAIALGITYLLTIIGFIWMIFIAINGFRKYNQISVIKVVIAIAIPVIIILLVFFPRKLIENIHNLSFLVDSVLDVL